MFSKQVFVFFFFYLVLSHWFESWAKGTSFLFWGGSWAVLFTIVTNSTKESCCEHLREKKLCIKYKWLSHQHPSLSLFLVETFFSLDLGWQDHSTAFILPQVPPAVQIPVPCLVRDGLQWAQMDSCAKVLRWF